MNRFTASVPWRETCCVYCIEWRLRRLPPFSLVVVNDDAEVIVRDDDLLVWARILLLAV